MRLDLFQVSVVREINLSEVKIVVKSCHLNLSEQWTVTKIECLQLLELSQGLPHWADVAPGAWPTLGDTCGVWNGERFRLNS